SVPQKRPTRQVPSVRYCRAARRRSGERRMAWDQGLSDEQRAMVSCQHGQAIRLLAGPGTGKTKCLVHRVAFLREVLGVEMQDVVFITFTRAAAKEIRRRLTTFFGLPEDALPRARTLHSHALSLMLAHSVHAGIDFPLRVPNDYEE